jgi:exopolysaccharide biosynthesis polyprenyl glycosylphosphotransferase
VIEDRTTLRQVPQQPADLTESEGMIGEQRLAVRALSPQLGFRWIGLGLAGCDALSLLCALLAVHVGTGHWRSITVDLLPTIGAGTVIWVAIFHAFGLHGSHRQFVRDELRGIVGATTAGVIAVFFISAWWSQPLTRSTLAWVLLFVLLFELLTRSLFRSLIQQAKSEGRLASRTLIVGTNEEARRLSSHLAPTHGLVPVGCVAVSSAQPSVDGLPVVGEIDELEEAIRYHGATCIFVASTAVSEDDVAKVFAACRRTNTEMRLSTNVSDILPSRLSIESVDGHTSLAVKPVLMSGGQKALKRSFDLVVGSVALLLALPLIAVITLAIRLTSPGPAIFRQSRVTKGGAVFVMYKFRTMVRDPERALDGTLIDLSRPFFKLRDDPRLTRVGRNLRSLSLDELPQLWNVIRGDMSLVGPRPLPAEQVAANLEFLGPRHDVRGGLTGLWQVSGRSDLQSDEALRIDRFYIENWSFGLDLSILGKTVGAVFGRRGAR